MLEPRRFRLELGHLLATANAVQTLDPPSIQTALERHARGDWGELDQEDRTANNQALRDGGRLLSVYRDSSGTKFYIVTEADRSVTTILLPEDY